MGPLEDARQEIDRLDEQIVTLLNARARVAQGIGRLKADSGAGVYAPDRERQILERIVHLSQGPLSKDSLLAIYRELMSASFALERMPTVGFLGPRGSFSHEAALAKFGSSVEFEPLSDITGVFDAVARGHVNYGVVPVENALVGAITESLDAFVEHEVQVCCEMYHPIHHYLMAKCPRDRIEVVYSKPEVFGQCKRWLTETGLVAKTCAAPSTSRAAQMAASQAGAAAIGGKLAAQLYGLPILDERIEDEASNATRFFIIGRESARQTGSDRTSLLFTTAHQPGALVEVLLVLQNAAINLTMITSRASRREATEYHFFVDIDGHAMDAVVQTALVEARQHCRTLKVLGSYPRGK